MVDGSEPLADDLAQVAEALAHLRDAYPRLAVLAEAARELELIAEQLTAAADREWVAA